MISQINNHVDLGDGLLYTSANRRKFPRLHNNSVSLLVIIAVNLLMSSKVRKSFIKFGGI